MTATQFAAGLGRLAGIILPALFAARLVQRRYLGVSGSLGALALVVLALSLMLVVAEALGLVGLMRAGPLTAALVLIALIIWRVLRGSVSASVQVQARAAELLRRGRIPDATSAAAIAAVLVVSAQWGVQTANALGSGMFNFDTLWYHMPFAARMARTAAVTGIQFTQADPFVAYYPANSELFHAMGIVAMHNDFLSPLLNLVWLGAALLASWCLGRSWHVERLALIAGCVVISLPVLSGTQPGEAFNDIVGLAMLLAAVALAVNAERDRRLLAVAGLALGIAIGTKLTFLIAALALLAGVALRMKRGHRWRGLGLFALPAALTAGWWYLRNLIAVGNPLGLRVHLGPLALPGPRSPLELSSQQTVISELSHVSLWGSRFAPGLHHALGPLWPVILALYLAGVLVGIAGVRDSMVRVLALTAALAGIAYLLLPTGATAIEQGTTIFQVNLRYATPALALGIVLVPIVVCLRAPHALRPLAPALLVLLAATQLESSLWPTQTARHLLFLIAAAGVAALILPGRVLFARPPPLPAVAGAALLVAVGAAAFAVQRHYFHRRYLMGDRTDRGLGLIYRWAQTAPRARIGLYGTVQQYPLYGASAANRVDYLGRRTHNGGFGPIASCRTWRTAVNDGGYRYVVLTPAPTAGVPVAWTQADPAARLVLRPASDDYVFELTGKLNPGSCA